MNYGLQLYPNKYIIKKKLIDMYVFIYNRKKWNKQIC